MKNKLLFLPDVFFVLLVFLSCERASVEQDGYVVQPKDHTISYSNLYLADDKHVVSHFTSENQVVDMEKLANKAKRYVDKIREIAGYYKE